MAYFPMVNNDFTYVCKRKVYNCKKWFVEYIIISYMNSVVSCVLVEDEIVHKIKKNDSGMTKTFFYYFKIMSCF